MVAYNLGGVFISSDSALLEIQAVAMEPEEGSRSTETPGVVNRGFQADEAASSAPRPGQGSGGGQGDQDQVQLVDCALLGLDLGRLVGQGREEGIREARAAKTMGRFI